MQFLIEILAKGFCGENVLAKFAFGGGGRFGTDGAQLGWVWASPLGEASV